MLPSVTDDRWCQNVKRTAMTHTPKGLFATFLFLPHFDLRDLSLNRHTATWIIIFPCYFSVKVKGALTYFLGCVAKEYVCGITWKFFATHRSFYNTALVINIEIEQWRHPATPMITWPETKISIILEVCHFDDRFSVDLVCLYKFTLNYAEILFDCFNANFKTQV